MRTCIMMKSYTNHGFNDMQQHQATFPPFHREQGGFWAYKDTLRCVTTSKTNGKLAINIWELQPTSDPLLPVIEAFYIPPQDGVFSFSPVSFHASFITWNEVIILNACDSKILLSTQVTQRLCTQPGNFSTDGCFFACRTLESRIYIWKNTLSGYIPWSTLQSRLPLEGFSFSPTAISIITWGPGGIQLLHPEISTSSPLPEKTKSLSYKTHLVACSADSKHIAIVRHGDSVVKFLDSLLGTPLWFINTSMEVWDIKIVNNTIFAVNRGHLFGWNLTAEVTHDICDTGNASISEILNIRDDSAIIKHFILSNDCSQIAFVKGHGLWDELTLYDRESQENNTCVREPIKSICFSADGNQLWVDSEGGGFYTHHLTSLGIGGREPWYRTYDIPCDKWSWVTFFHSPHGCHIGSESRWVEDSRGRKLLWLPPSWRVMNKCEMRWEGNCLALVNGHHPEPIIIELQP